MLRFIMYHVHFFKEIFFLVGFMHMYILAVILVINSHPTTFSSYTNQIIHLYTYLVGSHWRIFGF